MLTGQVLAPSGLTLDGTINMKNNQRGFTLIELLIYVTIFATMIGAVVGLAVVTSAQKVNSQITADVNYQGEATMAMIIQTVHQATSITSPTAGNSGGSLTLVMPTGSVNPTIFALFNDGITNRMRMSEGSTPTNNYLTNGRVSLSGLTFTNMSLSSTKGSVLIKLTLTYRTTSQRQELQFSKSFYGAATIP
jgi:prepilin-type N-terminal cleavage/methylation domain-containing protein